MGFWYTAQSIKGAKFRALNQMEDDFADSNHSREGEGPLRHFILVSVSIVVITSFSFWVGTIWGSRTRLLGSVDMTAITQYLPVLEDIPLSYELTQFNGSLMKPNIFRGPAGPEVDAAWKSLGVDYSPILVPQALAAKSGLQPDQVKVSAKYGGGYPANVEGLHHLHCLNLLRQALWYNFEYYSATAEGAFKNEPYVVELHVTHCLDILRQELMCSIDIGVLGQVWIHPRTPTPYVDFNTKHKCRDFDAIRRWAEQRQVSPPGQDDWLEPPKTGDRIYDEMP